MKVVRASPLLEWRMPTPWGYLEVTLQRTYWRGEGGAYCGKYKAAMWPPQDTLRKHRHHSIDKRKPRDIRNFPRGPLITEGHLNPDLWLQTPHRFPERENKAGNFWGQVVLD